MKQVAVRFYAELSDFLPEQRRFCNSTCSFELGGSVKDLIEAAGVPHTEVDLILVNGESVGFSYRVQDGDRISVFPVFESLDITSLTRLRAAPLRQSRFILDTHLGRLAAYLRMLGFDSLYRRDYQDEELARISFDERRILLTKDRGLLKRNIVIRGYFVRASSPRPQLAEVLRRFDLRSSVAPFQRCIRCNALLRAAQKEEISNRLPAATKEYYNEFHVCPACDRIYWKGSHYWRMRRFIEELFEQVSPTLPG